MEIVYIIAGIAIAVMLTEFLVPTGGALAVIGAVGLVGAGALAIADDANSSTYIGTGLITLGVLSVITSWIVGRKVLDAHRDEPVRTGWEELVGMDGDVREPLDPVGQIWLDGGLWKARIPEGEPAISIGNRVRVESVDGLTLIVRPFTMPAESESN